MSTASGLKIFDPNIATATEPGCGTIAANTVYYSKVFSPREMASFIFQALGPVAGVLSVRVSNSPKDDVDAGKDRWSVYTDVGTAGTFTIATSQRTPDTDEVEFVPFVDASPDLTVRVATTAALPACAASGSGVGKTLTASAVGVLTVNGVSLVLNDRVLVKNQANKVDNGVYKLTTAGTAGVAFILTRAIDNDAAAEMVTGTSVVATAGDAKTWVLAEPAVNVRITPQVGRVRLQLAVTSHGSSQFIADAYVRGS